MRRLLVLTAILVSIPIALAAQGDEKEPRPTDSATEDERTMDGRLITGAGLTLDGVDTVISSTAFSSSKHKVWYDDGLTDQMCEFLRVAEDQYDLYMSISDGVLKRVLLADVDVPDYSPGIAGNRETAPGQWETRSATLNTRSTPHPMGLSASPCSPSGSKTKAITAQAMAITRPVRTSSPEVMAMKLRTRCGCPM